MVTPASFLAYTKAQIDTLLGGKATTGALAAETARAQAAEVLKAPLASPAFTGTPTIGGTAVAKTTDISTAISNLVGAAPLALDTLVEIDAQLAADEGSAAALSALVATKATSLTTVPVKITGYTAGANEIVPVDTTAGTFTVTLPTVPADKTRVIVKLVASAATPNPVNLALGGSDVFNKAGGSTTGSLSLLNQAITVQYTASTGIWTVTGDDLPLSQLDARYVTPAAASATYVTFKNFNGTPVTGKHVQITLTADGTDISDIQVVTP